MPNCDPSTRRPRIGILGASLATGNRGVSALGASLVQLIHEVAPEAEITMLISHRNAVPFLLELPGHSVLVRVLNHRMALGASFREHLLVLLLASLLYRLLPLRTARTWLAGVFPWIRFVAEADHVADIRGGDSFSDIYGLKRFVMGSLSLLAVLLVRGEVLLLPQTYGPFKSRVARALARLIQRRATRILARDREGLETMVGLIGPSTKVGFCPDVAFTLPAMCPARPRIHPPLPTRPPAVLVGINVNGLMYRGGYNQSNMFGLRLDYRVFLDKLVLRVLAAPENHVLLVPHTFAAKGRVESDPDACDSVRAQVPPALQPRVHWVQQEYDQSEIKGIIGICDFFVGSRMHACIAALSQGIPAVGVAYSKKFAGVFESIGCGDWVIDGREWTEELAVDRIGTLLGERERGKPVLRQAIIEAQQRVRTTFRELFEDSVTLLEPEAEGHSRTLPRPFEAPLQGRGAAEVVEQPGAMNSSGASRAIKSPSILVVFANYGTGNDLHFKRVLEVYRSTPFRLELHALTNAPKDLGPDVRVHVGSPVRNPHSLPFGHRRILADAADRFDYFIYSEDDTLVTEENLRAFIEVESVLDAHEIVGFLRTEQRTDGTKILESMHGPYRWLPSSVVERGGMTFAEFTNVHSAFFMASRKQLQRAIASGGFLVAPHAGRYGMLESGASDIYTQCGLNRLVCISRLSEFLLPHLANRYADRWGVDLGEVEHQIAALKHFRHNGGWRGSLFEVETRLPRNRWSKKLYEEPEIEVLNHIPPGAESVLVAGSDWGATESYLVGMGKRVVGIPVDAVFGDALRRRGIEWVEGPIESAVESLEGRRFDCVLLVDVLHLVADPVGWLRRLRPLLEEGGAVLIAVPRTCDWLRVFRRFQGEKWVAVPKPFEESGVQRVTESQLKAWLSLAGLELQWDVTCQSPRRVYLREKLGILAKRLTAERFIVYATPSQDGFSA